MIRIETLNGTTEFDNEFFKDVQDFTVDMKSKKIIVVYHKLVPVSKRLDKCRLEHKYESFKFDIITLDTYDSKYPVYIRIQ